MRCSVRCNEKVKGEQSKAVVTTEKSAFGRLEEVLFREGGAL